MECLRDFIGVLGCGSEQPESGLTINSLPGIPMELLDALVNADQKTFRALWNDVQTRALANFSIALDNEFNKRYRKKSITQSFSLGKKIDLVTAETAAANELRGFAIDCDYPAVEWLTGSNLRMISMQELNPYLKAVPGSGTVTLKIFDLDTKEELYSTDVAVANLSVGWNRVPVNKMFDAERIACVYNATAIDSAQLELNPSLGTDFAGYINSWVESRCSSCDPCHSTIRGYKSANDLSSQVFGTSTFGLSGIFSIVCKYDGFVCANKQSFITPLWYMHGVELMVECLFNASRLNKFTLDKKKVSEARDYFQLQFEQSLSNVVGGIDLNMHDLCLECNEQLQQKVWLP